jgi:hypothetical protein
MATGMSLRPGVSRGHSTGRKRCLKDYLVYRPIPKAILALRDKPDVHPESYEMQLYYTKAHEGHERRYLYRGRILQSYVLFWVIMFILKSLCTMTTVTQWKVLKQGVHCILLLIDIF